MKQETNKPKNKKKTLAIGSILSIVFMGLFVLGDTIISDSSITTQGTSLFKSLNSGQTTAIDLRPYENGKTVRMVFWANESSTEGEDRIVMLNAHGNLEAVDTSEFAIYIMDDLGSMQNMMKFLARESYQPSLALVTVDNIGVNGGGTLNLGRNISGGASSVRFHANLDVNNSEVNNVDQINLVGSSAINTIATLNGRSTGAFNIVGGTNTGDIILKARNSTNSQITRLTVNAGDGQPSIQIGDGTSQTNITLTSPDGTEYNCGVANGGVFSCA